MIEHVTGNTAAAAATVSAHREDISSFENELML